MIPLIEQLEQTIAKQEQYLDELKQRLADAIEENRPLHHRVALKLFDLHAKYNSQKETETWKSEICDNTHNWSGDAHQFWLIKANRLIEQCESTNQCPLAAITTFKLVDDVINSHTYDI